MTWIMVDVEADGPVPGEYSMVSFGAIIVEPALNRTFFGQLKPISENYIPDALAVSGYTREETINFNSPSEVMENFRNWISANTRKQPRFISDNNGFDWMFICYYFHKFLKANPFGFSSTNLGSLYKGIERDMFVNFKHLRKTSHTHNPVDDARGNAEAMLEMIRKSGLKINL